MQARRLASCLALALIGSGCEHRSGSIASDPESTVGSADGPSTVDLIDATVDLGVDFVHLNGMEGHYWPVEILGSGVALVDYDLDGDLDIYFRQGGPIGPSPPLANPLLAT